MLKKGQITQNLKLFNVLEFINLVTNVYSIHLIKVISERFQSHFPEYVLMILKRFFA